MSSPALSARPFSPPPTPATAAPAPAAIARDRHVAEVEERVAEVMGVINTATAQLVEVIADVLRTGAWEGWGIRSPQHWVTWRCGVSPTRARRLVAMARRLAHLPATAERFAGGALSEDQAAVVCRHTSTAHDAQVAELATKLTVPQLQRTLPSLPRPAPEQAADDADAAELPKAHEAPPDEERREVTFGWRDDGRWWLRALLPAEEGAAVQAALEAARDAEFRTRHPDGFDRRQHDQALAAATALDRITWSDALARLAQAGHDTISAGAEHHRRPSDRNHVVVHVDADGAVPPRLHLGPLLPSTASDLATCDATVRAVLERDARPIALGRRRRTVPAALRLLIEHRDGGCRVPGCSQVRWLHIHHLVHWARGGGTEPSNLLALCPVHHRMLHHGRLFIRGDPEKSDGLTITDPDGRPLTVRYPKPPERLPDVPPYANPLGERLQSWGIIWN